ncbi:UNVERIFIED_CONTAM: hypothetical protein FKN15_065886 [Acipenser sinensis]
MNLLVSSPFGPPSPLQAQCPVKLLVTLDLIAELRDELDTRVNLGTAIPAYRRSEPRTGDYKEHVPAQHSTAPYRTTHGTTLLWSESTACTENVGTDKVPFLFILLRELPCTPKYHRW